MKYLAICLVLLFGVACKVKATDCDVECLSEKDVKYHGLKLKCTGNEVCNKNCKQVDSIYPPCLPMSVVCPYDCNGEKVIIGKSEFDCPKYMTCNPLAENTSCSKICIPLPCPNRDMYDCIDDQNLNIQGINLSCPKNTKCNKSKGYPCAFCIGLSGDVSPIRSWLTAPAS